MSRDGFKCNCCGNKEKQLHVHHRTYLNGLKPWEYDDSLLTTLCDDCHEKTHMIIDSFSYPNIIFTDRCINSNQLMEHDYLKEMAEMLYKNYEKIDDVIEDSVECLNVYFYSTNGIKKYFLNISYIDYKNKLVFVDSFYDVNE